MSPLSWKKRAIVDRPLIGLRRIWTTRCGRYRVVFSRPDYAVPPVYYAQRLTAYREGMFFWDNISKHRKKERAFAACEKEHKKHG